MTTTTPTTSSTSSITTTLGAGSGIDIKGLVDQLVAAQYENKNNTLTAKNDTLTAQISSVGQIKSAVAAFDSALKSLIKGGSLQTQPASSNTGIVRASAIVGKTIDQLSGTVEVRQLASAQVANAMPVPDKSAAIGTGKLTLTFGTATVTDGAMTGFAAGSGTPIDIDITSANSSLQGIADAINAKKAGVTASILTDGDGSRLVLKGATGASQAFTLAATEDSGAPGLAALNIGVGAAGTTIGTTAQDAIVAVDGLALKRPTNSIDDLIPGVKLDLVSASPGTKVSLGAIAPTDSLSQAVGDFVDAYNQLYAMLQTATDSVTGPLKTDSAAKALMRSMSQLTVKDMTPGAANSEPHTLAALGVATNRDGSLKIDATQLTKALVEHPAAVEAMFKDGAGVSAALAGIATAAASSTYGLGASEDRYEKAQAEIADDQQAALAAADDTRTRMTRQFASMDAIVASYKSTQTFLQQQVDAWNNSNN
ncbi:flagellar filament capping protein FliD [Sphingomonas sp. JC676]|uniref:flagellar filament capping protein FliD n=1 Tax=Sphingomonas sp. JC676 TaxID=2768065 RepID=UPI0016585C00|nr:flagellar filament capping protein FliD [Sphingomonas sp. JC676]MBC9034468.1 flagellar filament capping protein FliD [Sphingomonas sp. JC676]